MANLISTRLSTVGMNVWWDAERLEGGHQFPAEIVEAIIRQHQFLFLLSVRSVNSPWCRRELARAAELRKTIIPLRLDVVDITKIPLELSGLHNVDFRRGIDNAMSDLIRAVGLGQHPSTSEVSDDPFARDGRLIDTIAQQLLYGRTFTNSLNLILLLSNIGVKWSLTDRARKIFEDMRQPQNFGGRIDYDQVAEFLRREWEA